MSQDPHNIFEQISNARALISSGKINEGISSLNSILSYCRAINFSEGAGEAAYHLANYYDKNDMPDKTIELCNIALPIFIETENKGGEARSYLIMGKAYSTLGNPTKQAEFLFKGLEIAIDIKDRMLQQKFYSNISNYYQFYLKDMDKCLEYMNIASELAQSIQDHNLLLINYLNLGIIHCYRNEYEKAMGYLHMAEETNRKFVNDEAMKCYTVLYIGTVYHYQKKNELALQCFLEGLNIAETNNFPVLFGECSVMTGQTYKELGEYGKAEKILEKGIEKASEKNIIRLLLNLYLVYMEMYLKTGNYKNALLYYEKYRQARMEQTSLVNEKNFEAVKFLGHLEQSQKESQILKEKNEELFRINNLLIQADKEKNDFMGIVVHDLKNPLTNIILISGNIRKNFERFPKDKKENLLEKIYLSCERMVKIIDNLLDINKIESGNIILLPKEVNLRKLLTGILSEFEVYSSQKNINIILNCEGNAEVLFADEMVLKEIFANLISNSLKYSYPGSEINIRYYKNDRDKKVVQISDKGMGIKQDEKEKVFQKFAKISNKPTAGENSTGLGLSIVKKLTELSGGTINFESEFGKGTTFTLTF